MNSKARKRHEKAQDRAVTIMERTEKKVALSKDQSRAIHGRRKVWDEINQNIISSNNDKPGPKGTASRDEDGTDQSEFDDEMGEAGGERGNQQGGADNVDIMRPTTETTVDQDDQDDQDGIL